MANIRRRANGNQEIRYVDHQGERRSLYAGNISKRDAESIASKVEHIVSRKVQGAEPEPSVAAWINQLEGVLHTRLVKHGLVPPRIQPEPEPEHCEASKLPTIKEWTDRYIKAHATKDSTIEQLEITARSLCLKFGDGKLIDSFTVGDAEEYRNWLKTKGNERKKYKTGLAENTVRRRIGRAKQFFNAAIKHELITRNPFADEVSAVKGNAERLFLVPSEWIERCIQVAPCEDWRIILAFARYAGMRSHECRIQRWEDIDIANNRMIVRSMKTPPVRSCPIFPELRPHLLRAREMAPAGAEFIQTRYSHDANLLTTMEKIVTKAGLVPWPKLMQNLRATRETELLAHYPAKDVCSWLGNSPEVANNHYAMTMQASFNRAVTDGAKIAGVTSIVPLNIPQTLQDEARNDETEKTDDEENAVKDWVCLVESLADLPLSCPTRT